MKKIFKFAFVLLIIGGVAVAICAGLGVMNIFGPKAESVAILSGPNETTFLVGQSFNPEGMKILVEYKNEKKDVKQLDVKKSWVSGTALNRSTGKFEIAGEAILKVTYGGKSAFFTVTVIPFE